MTLVVTRMSNFLAHPSLLHLPIFNFERFFYLRSFCVMENKLGIFSPDYDRKAAAHNRCHVKKGIVNPKCKLCCGEK